MEPSRLLDLLDDSCPPFALLRRRTPGRDHDTVEVLIGAVHEAEHLADLPVRELPTLALVPFRQIRERGFDVRDDGTPLSVLVAEEAYEIPLAEALAALPDHPVRVEDGGFDVPDEEYAATVERVIRDEIGRGEGANFVIRRTYEGRIDGFGRADALALFRRLLLGERGRTGRTSSTPGGARWSGPAPRCTCGCRAGGASAKRSRLRVVAGDGWAGRS